MVFARDKVRWLQGVVEGIRAPTAAGPRSVTWSSPDATTHVVVGGAGFVGSWVVERLVAEGKSVVALDNLVTGRLENLAGIRGPGSCAFVRGDARDRVLLRQVVPHAATLIHLAALVGVDKVCEDPYETYANNLDSTRAILDVAVERNCRVFVASTSEAYAEAGERAVAEHDRTRAEVTACGRGNYVQAKLAAERLSLMYHQTRGLEVVIGRLFNTIGPRQCGHYGMVVPRFVEQAVSGAPMSVVGDGTQVRSFCSVVDTARAILALCSERRATGQIFNIGAMEPVSIRRLADYIRAQTGSTSPVAFVGRPSNRSLDVDVTYRQPNIDKITALTGWEPTIGWRSVVRELTSRAVLGKRIRALS